LRLKNDNLRDEIITGSKKDIERGNFSVSEFYKFRKEESSAL